MALLDIAPFRRWPRSRALFDLARDAASLRRQRDALRRLDDTALADLGLTREEAEAEARRPVWDVPENWRGR